MSPLTQAVITALSMSDHPDTMTTEEILDTYLIAAELRRRMAQCPEHLFSTDNLDTQQKPAA